MGLATSFAAHFVNWVDKTDEIKQILARFARLYIDPEETLRDSPPLSMMPGPPLGPKELPSDMIDENLEEEISSPPPLSRAINSSEPLSCSSAKAILPLSVEGGLAGKPPWSPTVFSALSRAKLRDGLGVAGSNLAILHRALWPANSSRSIEKIDEEEFAVPNVCDFQTPAQIVADPAAV